MWLERFVIVVTSLHRDFLPSSWGMYYPTIWDWATFVGTIGLFLALLFLFIRFLPMISIFEMRDAAARVEGEGLGARAAGRRDEMSHAEDQRAAPLRPDGRVRRARTRSSPRRGARVQAGYRKLDAYTPFPIEELTEALGFHRTRVPLLVLIGGIVGGAVRLRPAVLGLRHRLPAQRRRPAAPQLAGVHPVPTFETTVLFAALTAVLGMLALNGLPHALPPGVQRAAVRAGDARPLLPVHRGRAIPKFDLEAHAAVPGELRATRGDRS